MAFLSQCIKVSDTDSMCTGCLGKTSQMPLCVSSQAIVTFDGVYIRAMDQDPSAVVIDRSNLQNQY